MEPEFARHGLPVLYVMGLFSIAGLTVFFWRVWELRRSRILPRDFRIRLGDLVAATRIDEAMTLCRLQDGPFARVALAGLRRFGASRTEVKERLEEVGRLEAQRLNAGLSVLDLVAVLTPMMGLLGTVWGMIDMFLAVRTHGVGDAAALAGGIGTALYTTLGGLVVAVPARLGHTLLSGRVDAAVLQLEEEALELLERMERGPTAGSA